MKTIDRTFIELCDEIDYLKDEIIKLTEDRNYWRDLHTEQMNKQIIETDKAIGTALLFALSIRDDENGNLVVPSNERIKLAERFKS